MRPTLRLFAAVKPGRFLEAGNPTGLTGLATHPSPRPYLLYVYSATLERLRSIPESSVYRQSTEALTKHRMKIVEAAIPAGFEEWQKRIAEKIEKNPEAFAQSGHQVKLMGQDAFIQSKEEQEEDLDYREWDGEKGSPTLEGPRTERAGDFNAAQTSIERPDPSIVVALEPEPPLDVSQISDIEGKIGAGLIEEVIQVAEGELKLVKRMTESRAWEALEEKPLPGQWEYSARDTHVPGTQEPPNK